MRLIKVGCEGYKRFRGRAEMDVDEKLIAIVGPNEAGKSTLLSALAQLDNEELPALPTTLRTRGTKAQPKVWARFVLDEGDKAALSAIPEAREVRQYVVQKAATVTLTFEPDVIRDTRPRRDALKAIQRALRHPWLKNREDTDELLSLSRHVASVLASEKEDLEPSDIEALSAFAAALREAKLPGALVALPDKTAKAHANEEKENPWNTVTRLPEQRRPRFLLFEESARDLRSSYSFDEEPNQALHNLLSLAGTNWQSLYQSSSDPGALEGLMENARKQLDAAFSVWTQDPLIVRISATDNAVTVMVRMRARTDFLAIEEHSDGLRQFVALRAHVASRGENQVPPILLVDEADVHLHYNAQADLVHVFEIQEQAAKVIYTTHSAGCLPQDLGRGIRIILPIAKTDDSRIVNWFWTDDIEGTGFSPLLIGMGASALAFASTRRAVIAEGPSDAILLPTMLREATGRDRLDYQVAPGLANVDAATVPDLDLVASRVAYVLDGDAAGDAKAKLLLKAGVPKGRIMRLGPKARKIVLEDLLDETIYLAAINEELSRWSAGYQVPKSALSATCRPKSIESWCKRQRPPLPVPSKRAVAHRVLEHAKDGPILNRRLRANVKKLHDSLVELLSQSSHSGS
jgi:predicted ATP-dependent endonuclease of OLD family